MISKGNHPQMGARFRLVNYYNLPRYYYLAHINISTINPRIAGKYRRLIQDGAPKIAFS